MTSFGELWEYLRWQNWEYTDDNGNNLNCTFAKVSKAFSWSLSSIKLCEECPIFPYSHILTE